MPNKPFDPPQPFRLLDLAAVWSFYLLLAWVSQELIYNHTDICSLWPAAGVGLLGVLRHPLAGGLGVFLGSFSAVAFFFARDLEGLPLLLVAGTTAGGATLEALLAGVLIRHWIGGSDRLLDHFPSQLGFFGITLLSAAASACVGVGIRYFTHRLNGIEDSIFGVVLWWVGDTLGVLLVVPFVLAVCRPSPTVHRVHAGYRMLFVGIMMVLAAGSFYIKYPLALWLLFGVLWSCFYLIQPWSLGTALVISFLAFVVTTRQVGPFTHPTDPLYTALNLYPFILLTTFTALTVSGGVQIRVRRSELDAILERSPAGIGWVDEEQRRFIEVNDQLATELGYDSKEELLALEDVENAVYTNPAERRELLQELDQSPDNRADKIIIARRKDGRRIYLHVYARRVRRNGQSLILGFARDVTDGRRRRKVNELIQQVARDLAGPKTESDWVENCLSKIQTMLEAEQVSLWLISENRRTIQRHSLAHNLLADAHGVKLPEQLTAGNLKDLILREENPSNSPPTQVIPLEMQGKIEGCLVVRDPGWHFSDDEGAKALKRVAGTTGQMLIEAIRANLWIERNRDIRDLAEVGIFYADASGTNTHNNPRCRAIQGMSDHTDPREWPRNLTEDCRERVVRDWEEYVRQRQETPPTSPEIIYRQTETFLVENDIRTVEVTARPVRTHGNLQGFVGVVQDITNLHNRLLEANLVAHVINHDMQNSLLGLSDILKELRSPDSSNQEDLLKNALSFHADIQGLARQVTGEHDPRKELFAMEELRNIPLSILRERPQVPVKFHGDWNGKVIGPRKNLARVLTNLVKNAVKSSTDGKDVVVAIKKESGQDNAILTLSVTNYGPELPEEVKNRLNWRCDQLKAYLYEKPGNEPGRGLPLCRLALEGLGEFTYSRTEDGVNRFSIRVSIQEVATESSRPTQAEGWSFSTQRGPVLLAEDMPNQRGTLARKLIHWGIDPLVVCESAERAVELVEKDPTYFALILMDIHFGNGKTMNGYEAVRGIRNITRERNSNLKILSISATDGEAATAYREAAFDGHISKLDLDDPRKLARLWFGTNASENAAPVVPENAHSTRNVPRLSPQQRTQLVCSLVFLTFLLPQVDGKFDQLRHQLLNQHAWLKDWLARGLRADEYSARLNDLLAHLLAGSALDEVSFARP